MIKVYLNDVIYEVEPSITIAQFLSNNQIQSQQCAIAINQKVISKSLWETTPLSDGDRVLLIRAVQGG